MIKDAYRNSSADARSLRSLTVLNRNSERIPRKLVGAKRACPPALWRQSRHAGLQGSSNSCFMLPSVSMLFKSLAAFS
jgi:hypothetical protein